MKKILLILILLVGCLRAQILKATTDGFILVKDSITNSRITADFYDNFKGKYRYTIRNNGSDWFLKNQGKYFIPTIDCDSLIVLSKKEGWGCINKNGKEKISFSLSDPVSFFKNGQYFGFGGQGTYGLLGGSSLYDEYDKYGYKILDWKGNSITTYIEMIDNNGYLFLMAGKESDKCGIISSNMDTLFPFEYGCTSWDAKNFGFGDLGFIALKNKTGLCGVLDKNGKIVLPFEYDYIDDMVFDVMEVHKDGKKGMVDKNANWIVPMEYKEISSYYDVTGPVAAILYKDNYCMILDSTLKIHPTKFDAIYSGGGESDPNLLAKTNGKFGIYDPRIGTYPVKPEYDTIISYRITQDFYYLGYPGDHILLVKGNSFTILDHSLKQIASFEGEYIEPSGKSDLLILQKQKKKYVVKDNGEVIAGPYDDLRFPNNDREHTSVFRPYFFAKMGSKYGWITAEGKVFIPFEYDAGCESILKYSNDGNHGYTFILLKKNTIYYFDKNGESLGTENWNKYDSFCDQ